MLALIQVYWDVQSSNLSSWRRHFLKTKEAPQSLLCMIHFPLSSGFFFTFPYCLSYSSVCFLCSFLFFYSLIISSSLCRYPGANLLNSCSTCVSFINRPQCSLTRRSLHRYSAALFSTNTFKKDFLLITAAVINQRKIK